jgi:putative transposase
VIQTPIRTPVANTYAERFVQTVRRECLDWLPVGSERHLRRVLLEYLEHYHHERPHRRLALRPPDPTPKQATGPVSRRDRFDGRLYEYHRAAA